MKKSWLWLVCMAVIGVCSSARAQNAVWIDVPIIQGPSGNYTCITRPTGDMRIAIISCDPVKFNMFPPFVQQFLIAHEHGHVYQIVYNPAVMYGPYAEYDADCFAAVYLAQTDPSVLTRSYLINTFK